MTQGTAAISRTVAAIEKALARALKEQGCAIEHDCGVVMATALGVMPGVDGMFETFTINVSRLAIDVERELA